MSSPENFARMLMAYYVEKGTDVPLVANLVIGENDNVYISELLLSIYVECNKLYRSGQLNITQTKYAEYLNHVFFSIGYMINMEIFNRNKLNEIIHFVKITNSDAPNMISPYHPFSIIKR